MSEQIKEGDWVCIKCPANQISNVPMFVTDVGELYSVVVWFLSDRSLSTARLKTIFLEKVEEGYWNK